MTNLNRVQLLGLVTPEAKEMITKGYYEWIFDKARKDVRAREAANEGKPHAPTKWSPASGYVYLENMRLCRRAIRLLKCRRSGSDFPDPLPFEKKRRVLMRNVLRTVVAGSVLFGIGVSPALAEEPVGELKKQLDEAKQLILMLEKRIDALESKEVANVPSHPAVSPKVQSTTGEETEKPGKFTVYGFAQTDLIQDFNRVNPDWNAALRPSRIPTTEGLYGEDGETILSVRQTRFGVKSTYPTSFGDFETKLEIDFFGVGSDAGQTTVRPRHFYGKLGPVLAGQTHSLFMDINVFPNTIDYWGPSGMVFLRNPQVRWTPLEGDTTFAIALEDPGNDVSWGVNEPETNSTLQSKNELPDLTARLSYSGDWGYVQAGGILRQVGFETVGNEGSNPSGDAVGWGLNLSTNINVLERDRIILSTVFGEAIANYMNDGGSDVVVVNGDAQTLPLLGVVAYYDHYWTPSLSSSLGYSFTEIDNHEQQSGDSFKMGEYASANLLWTPWEKTLFGVEYLWGQREDKDGDSGEDHRIQFSFKYSFDRMFEFDL